MPGPESDEEGHDQEERPEGVGHTAAMTTALLLAFSGMAMAAVPQSVPNSGASHNCVATTSGILYFREHGIQLGRDVSKVAPHGGQRAYVQEALQKTC